MKGSFGGQVKEYYGMLTELGLCTSDKLAMMDRQEVYLETGKGTESLISRRDIVGVSLSAGKIWYKLAGQDAVHSVDGCGAVSVENVNSIVAVNKGVFGSWVVGVEEKGFLEFCLTLYNVESHEVREKDGEYIDCVVSDGIVLGRTLEEIHGFDLELNLLWKFNVSSWSDLDVTRKRFQDPCLYSDIVITNVGLNKELGRVNYIAISALDARELWRFELESDWAANYLLNDKYFVLGENKLTILDPNNGDEILAKNLDINGSSLVYPFENHYVIFGEEESSIRIYNEGDFLEIQRLELPLGYMAVSTRLPIIFNGCLAVFLRRKDNTTKAAGEAVLFLSCGVEGIEVEERPAMLMMEAETQDNEKVYAVTISESDIHRLMRFAAIRIFELGCSFGNHDFGPNNQPDKNHKGKIKLVVDQQGLPEDAEPQLAEWAKNVEQDFADLAIYPGAGEDHRFTIEVELSKH